MKACEARTFILGRINKQNYLPLERKKRLLRAMGVINLDVSVETQINMLINAFNIKMLQRSILGILLLLLVSPL